ncbi:MAG: arylamine N-acetyltransferase [Bacteroidota bacterium]
MDVQKYLTRISFQGPIIVDKNTLYSLQKTHLLNVPFENLDIHYNRKISLSLHDIYKKIVVQKRGGFCYELNGLFHWLLAAIGFNAKLVSARVYTENDKYSPEYDHLAILVDLDGQGFLVDVGFGKFSFEPLPIQLNELIYDSYGVFVFDNYNATYIRVNEKIEDKRIPQYIFSTKERTLTEFKERCAFHQQSKDSHFTQKKVVSIAKEDGRITLNNTQLKISKSGKEQLVQFEENGFEAKLKQFFSIEIEKDKPA